MIRQSTLRWIGVSVAAVLFAGLTIFFKSLQFDSLQTQLYDLSETTNVLWNTFHGRPFWSGLMGENYLGQHFAPALAFLGPFLWFGDTAFPLIVAQCLALAAALPAVYMLGSKISGRPVVGGVLAAFFVFSPYVHEVIRVDFHEVGVGLALTVGALAAWETGRRKLFWWLVAATLLLREDYGLYWAGFCAALFFSRAADRRGALIGAAAGVLWSALLIFLVMPTIAGGAWKPAAFAFGPETKTGASLARYLLSPAAWAALFGTPERLGHAALLLLSVGGLSLLAPSRAPAWALPLFLNALAANPWQQRFDLHYSATVLPYLFWTAAHGVTRLSVWADRRRLPRWVGALAAGGALVLLVWNGARIPKYFAETSPARRAAARRMAGRIPPGDSVMAQTNLLPRVCRRENVSLVPGRGPAQWIFLDNRLAEQAMPRLWEAQKRFLEAHRAYIVDAEEDLVLLSPGIAPVSTPGAVSRSD